MLKMVDFSVLIILIFFEPTKLISNAFNTYCSLPCPFMCPAQPPRAYGYITLPPRRPSIVGRASFDDTYTDYECIAEDSQPLPVIKSRQQPAKPDPPAPPPSKPKPPPEDLDPPPRKKKASQEAPPAPIIQPSRRFFTSLFSIPGAVVDTLLSGEVVL